VDPIDEPNEAAEWARQLAPGDERGTSLLIAGGTATQRGARVRAVLVALESSASRAPLVVHVRAGSVSAESTAPRLADEIASTAEAALGAVAAPGPLYDDPGGGPLAPLGGWLFRARSAGRRGIVLVLEESDGWFDARGGANVPDGTDVLDAAQRECERRPFSLIVTLRASDASGQPALGAERVSRFALRQSLGGASTVTRDPMTLVTSLAGRSFSMFALRNALQGWLDVPGTGDETIITFTSPFAPAAVGPLPDDAVEAQWPARAETPDAGGVTPAPDDVPTPAVAPTSDPVATWTAGIRAAITIGRSLAALKEPRTARSHRQYERILRDGAAQLPLAVDALARAEHSLAMPPTRLRTRGEQAYAAFRDSFADFFVDASVAWQAGSARPMMLCDIPTRLAQLATERRARGTALVLLSGLRLDAWQRTRRKLIARLPGLSLIEEGVLWAVRPTTPAMQRELLARGLEALSRELPARNESPPAKTLADAMRPRREHIGPVEVLRLDAYALQAQRSADSLDATLAPVDQALPEALWQLCGTFAGRTILATAGDAGFREVPHRRIDEGPRYEFGGDSPLEAVVPYALWLWG